MIKIYVSHSIRGTKGKDATDKQMEYNCDRIKLLVNQVRESFPDIKFYVPAEHEEFVHDAHTTGWLTEKQILNIDCGIIAGCDAVAVFLPQDDAELQGGRKVECDFANRHDIPVLEFGTLNKLAYRLTSLLGL